MDVVRIGVDVRSWIYSARDRDYRRVLVNVILNFLQCSIAYDWIPLSEGIPCIPTREILINKGGENYYKNVTFIFILQIWFLKVLRNL